MGIALILLGLLAAGLVVDFAAENWSAGTADLTFALFGGSFTLTQMQVVLAAAVLGAAAVVLCALGARPAPREPWPTGGPCNAGSPTSSARTPRSSGTRRRSRRTRFGSGTDERWSGRRPDEVSRRRA